METYHYILIGVGVVLFALVLFFLIKKPKKQEKSIDLTGIVSIIDKTNVNNISYIRNKIVIEFKDVTKFDTQKLLESGALGINIVGDKIKFYLDGGNEKNEEVFKELRRYIER